MLATIPPERAGEFERRAAEAGTRVTRVGVITAGATGVIATDADGRGRSPSTKTGWDHFQTPDVT